MNRRDAIKVAALSTTALAVGTRAQAGKKAPPDYMPILNKKMAAGNYVSRYEERELTEPVLLCDAEGRLNPAARGWSRRPLIRANLSGHWPRKKKWNFWNFIAPGFVFSVTVSDIDLGSFCAVTFTDFQTKDELSLISIHRHGYTVMPEEVERTIVWKDQQIDFAMHNDGGDIQVQCHCPSGGGRKIAAEFVIRKAPGHETLNLVAPWSDERFQMNSKHNTLPIEGYVSVKGKRYVMNPEECHGVQDFGRGMWPYRSYWNWGVVTGRQGDDLIGVNMGAKWTTGTGANENGFCLNGRLYKIMEDLVWEYDRANWMKPWRVRAPYSKMLDLTLTPFLAKATNLNLGIMKTGGTCSFGRWNGAINCEGRTIEVKDLIGWAEEFSHRW